MSWSFDRCPIIASVGTLWCNAVANSAAAGLTVACWQLADGWKQPVKIAVRTTTASTAGIVLAFFTIAPKVRPQRGWRADRHEPGRDGCPASPASGPSDPEVRHTA